jgi:hypothetical protein
MSKCVQLHNFRTPARKNQPNILESKHAMSRRIIVMASFDSRMLSCSFEQGPEIMALSTWSYQKTMFQKVSDEVARTIHLFLPYARRNRSKHQNASVYRRKLKLKPKFDNSFKCSSFKRSEPGGFNMGLIGSICTALPQTRPARAPKTWQPPRCSGVSWI